MNCNSRRLIITEEEKKRILSLYNLISEDAPSVKNNAIISGNTFFDDGKWKDISPTTKAELISQITNAANLLRTNKGAFSTIKITAGESQVTNYDREVSGDVKLKPGELSNRRAETMYKFLEDQFKQLLEKGVINKMPVFERPFETKIGLTEYVPGTSDKNDPRYIPEKFVTAILTIKEPSQCLVGLGIQVVYYKTPDPNYPCRGGHRCDLADFTVNVNGVALGKVSLNNGKDGEDRIPARLYITPEMAKSISANNKDKIVISLVCNSAGNCHTSTPEVFITKKDSANKDVTIFHKCAAPQAGRGDMKERVLLTLDGCGNVIEEGTMDSENMSKGDKTVLSNLLKDKVTELTDFTTFENKLIKWGFKSEKINNPETSKNCLRSKLQQNVDSFTCKKFQYETKGIKITNKKDNTTLSGGQGFNSTQGTTNEWVKNTIFVGTSYIYNRAIHRASFYESKYNSFSIENGNVFYETVNASEMYPIENILKTPISIEAAKELGKVNSSSTQPTTSSTTKKPTTK